MLISSGFISKIAAHSIDSEHVTQGAQFTPPDRRDATKQFSRVGSGRVGRCELDIKSAILTIERPRSNHI